MRKMKDSGVEWIGQIPLEWDVCKLKYLIGIKSGDAIRNEDISSDGLYQVFGGGEIIGYTNKQNANEKNLLIGRVGARCGCVTKPLNKVYATDNALVVFTKENRNYFYDVLVSADLNKLNSSNAQPLLTATKIKNVFVPHPSLAEQQRIADFLDEKCGEIDSIRSDIQKQIDILNDYKKSVITEAVIKGLNPKAKLKDSGIEWIGKIPEGWNVIRLKDFSYMKGRIGWQGLKSEEFIDEGPYCVTGTDFKNGSIDWNTCYHISEERYKMDANIHLKVGDLLITKDGTVGKLARVSYLPDKACLNSHLLIIRPLKQKFKNDFLFYMMSSDAFLHYCKYAENGTTMASLSQEKMGKFKFPLPPLSEQKEIADYLDEKCSEIDAVVADKQKQLETLDEYKKSLIFEYVTGKKECV